MSSLISRNQLLEIAVKNYAKDYVNVFRSRPVLLDSFRACQMLWPGLWICVTKLLHTLGVFVTFEQILKITMVLFCWLWRCFEQASCFWQVEFKGKVMQIRYCLGLLPLTATVLEYVNVFLFTHSIKPHERSYSLKIYLRKNFARQKLSLEINLAF